MRLSVSLSSPTPGTIHDRVSRSGPSPAGRLSSRIAAARARAREHHGRRSSAACRSAPTASSWTSTSRATASPSSSTTHAGAHDRRDGRSAALTADELARVDAGYRFAAAARIRVSRSRPRASRRWTRCSRVIPTARHHRDEGGRSCPGACGRRTSSPGRAVDRVCVGSFGIGRASNAARQRRPRIATSASQSRRDGRSTGRGFAGRSARERPYCAFQVPESAGRASSRRVHPQAHQQGCVSRSGRSTRRRHAAPARLGRRRGHHRSAGCGSPGATRDG